LAHLKYYTTIDYTFDSVAITEWQLERVSHDTWCYMTSH
jgi:hypothetical protein